jgi:hypothetical protein
MAGISIFYKLFRVLDNLRVKVAVATKKYPMKLYVYTANGIR